MKITDVKNFDPKCPHCEQRIDEIYRISDDAKGFFQRSLGYCYACSKCQKIIGFSDYSS
ncbi:MAG: hypothetical protein NE328_04595 [Lentisphaeraceae bacterium]|nr:hypothetical protein [Lentisphaeraceae bacterium]